jgi:hypothetical protein
MPAACKKCLFPSWSEQEDSTDRCSYNVALNYFESLSASGDKGCVGCTFLSLVWRCFLPDVATEREIEFDFNPSGGHLRVCIKGGPSGTHDVDIFTLYGT